MKCAVIVVVLIEALILKLGHGQRIPPPPQSFLNSLNNPLAQNGTSGSSNSQIFLQQQSQGKTDELANIKDENIKKVLGELSSLQTATQRSDTMDRVAQLVGPLYFFDYESRKDHILVQSRDPSSAFPLRLLSAVTDIQGEEVKALVLQKKLDVLHSADFAFLPLAMQYGFQDDILRNLSGTKLAAVVKTNPGDTVIAFKVSSALVGQPDQQIEFLQSLGAKLLPDVQRIIIRRLLEWWGDAHQWKDRQLNLLISAGSPLLSFLPQSELQSLDDELADRFVTTLGQTQDIARGWWRKPMSLKKAWFELAKGARYFGAVHEWSFRRMQKLSFLLEGASPEDLQLIPPVPEIRNLVVGNHYMELQARVVFDAFYNKPPLSQEDLQEFQFHILDLTPSQLQRFDFADSFGTLDEMFSILERQKQPSYSTILQISYFMWPILNSTNSIMTIAPPSTWQKRELAQVGKLFFLLPKSVLSQIRPDIIDWDSNILAAIRSNHLTPFQIWRITSQILKTVDDRFKPDYIFMIPSPFQKGIPSQNISQALLGTTVVRPEILRALIEETDGMLISQKSVLLQRISNRISESLIIRMMISSSNPSEMFHLISPKILNKNMASIVKTIMEMPETGRFGITSVQVKLLPRPMLSLWLKWVRENAQVAQWTAEDLLGRSPMGATHELNLAILGLGCRDIENVDPYDIISVIMHYRHELYSLRRFKPTLVFNVNLRTCVLEKFMEYLKEKTFLNGDNPDGRVLAEIDGGEIEAVGGEILSFIPTTALEALDAGIRLSIVNEIGKLQMMELFSLVTLDDLQWYGRTLFNDILTVANNNHDATMRRRRDVPLEDPAATATEDSSVPSHGETEPGSSKETTTASNATESKNATETPPHLTAGTITDLLNEREVDPASAPGNETTEAPASQPPPPKVGKTLMSFPHGINIEALNSLGNLICYADNMFDTNWPRSLLKDILESKTSVGEKTCCLSKPGRDKWFEVLKEVYGSDTSTWNEFDLAAIGDLLIVLPEEELQKISTDSLAKALTPIMRQSAYSLKLYIPGDIKRIQFVKACAKALGKDGEEYMGQHKILMKRLFQAAQWEVNTVKTTQELIRDGVGRTGRIPRWAEHILVKRQVPLNIGGQGDVSFGGVGTASPTATPVPMTTAYPATAPGFYPTVTYAPPPMMHPYGMPMGNPYMAQPMMYPQPTFAPQFVAYPSFAPQIMTQPMVAPQQIAAQPITTGGTGATAATNAGGGGTAGLAAAGTGGGSFSTAGTQASNTGANAFSQGGSFAPASDTGAGFGQASANTLALRSSGQQQQPQQPQSGPQQPQPGSQALPPQANPAGTTGNQPPVQSSSIPPSQPQPQPGATSGQPQPPPSAVQPPAISPPIQQAPPPSGQPNQPPGPQTPPGPGNPQQPPTGPVANPPPGSGQPVPSGPGPANQPPAQQAPPGITNPPPGQQAPSGPVQQQPPPQPIAGPPQQAPVPVPSRDGNAQAALQRERARSINFGALQDDTHTSEITCHGIKAAGDAAIGLTIEDLNKLTEADLFDCVEPLGKIEWDDALKSQIVTLLKDKLDFTHEAINSITLIEFGDLVTAFSAQDDSNSTSTSGSSTDNVTIHSDISMIDLTLPQSLDVLSILGQEIIEPELLKSLAEKFNQDNRIFPSFSEGIARPENLRIVVMSLGNILCGLSDKIVNSIFENDPSLFIDTSCVLGKLEGCGTEVLSTLAAHSVRPSNYGPSRLWSQEDVETIGVVVGGLKPDAFSQIPPEAMQGLTPLAVKNMPIMNLLSLTPDQLKMLSYNAARAFTPDQLSKLKPATVEAIQAILQVNQSIFELPKPPPVEDPNDNVTEVLRSIPTEEDTGVGGRSGGHEPVTPPPTTIPTTTPTTTEPTTEKPPDVDVVGDKSSGESLKSTGILAFSYLLAIFLPVIRFMNI